MSIVRIGVIGIGGMGSAHAKNIVAGEVGGAEVTAVCDIDPDRLAWARKDLAEDMPCFENAEAFFSAQVAEDLFDAVIIATPHYDHPPLAIEALNRGLHVLTEKPAGVYIKQVREMNAVAAESHRVFGIMYNQRTIKSHLKMRDLVRSGEIGELKRVIYIITNWYRSQSYFDSGGWRATWAGEGGGVLLNQCPHQLDLWQWICGMPVRLRAYCEFGKYHDIEVDDEVTAYVEYPNGATGVFLASTAECPGTNRLEIAGNNGKVVLENGQITFWRLETPEREFNATHKGGFGAPQAWKCDVPGGPGPQHVGILRDWIAAIRSGTELLAPGEEGINALMLSNAMLLSSWTDSMVDLPIDEDRYYDLLQERIQTSRYVKPAIGGETMDVDGTFG